MVRFHWHVEEGLSAFIPPGGFAAQKESGVKHASCEIEVSFCGPCSAGSNVCVPARRIVKQILMVAQIPAQKETLPGLLTLPSNWLHGDQVGGSQTGRSYLISCVASCLLGQDCCSPKRWASSWDTAQQRLTGRGSF